MRSVVSPRNKQHALSEYHHATRGQASLTVRLYISRSGSSNQVAGWGAKDPLADDGRPRPQSWGGSLSICSGPELPDTLATHLSCRPFGSQSQFKVLWIDNAPVRMPTINPICALMRIVNCGYDQATMTSEVIQTYELLRWRPSCYAPLTIPCKHWHDSCMRAVPAEEAKQVWKTKYTSHNKIQPGPDIAIVQTLPSTLTLPPKATMSMVNMA